MEKKEQFFFKAEVKKTFQKKNNNNPVDWLDVNILSLFVFLELPGALSYFLPLVLYY